jgi:hypothetical protein
MRQTARSAPKDTTELNPAAVLEQRPPPERNLPVEREEPHRDVGRPEAPNIPVILINHERAPRPRRSSTLAHVAVVVRSFALLFFSAAVLVTTLAGLIIIIIIFRR